MKDVLESKGYEVVPQLGVAGYFVDLAVKNPERLGEFMAAIECDGASYHSSKSARDRDRIRQEILESLGWKDRIYRIWSTDWFYNPRHETERLLEFLEKRRMADSVRTDDEDYYYNRIYKAIENLKYKYLSLDIHFDPILHTHPTIRNYYKIVTNTNYIRPEIGEYIILPTHEAVAVLKTFWIRIIQKKWKKVLKQKQQMIEERCKLPCLQFRQITGYWPAHCKILPTLKGMLHKLKK